MPFTPANPIIDGPSTATPLGAATLNPKFAEVAAYADTVAAIVANRSRSGSGSPEGIITADQGSYWLDTDSNTPWYKAVGTGNTGWTTTLPVGTVRVQARPDTGADLTTAIQTAITAAQATTAQQGTVLFERGVYLTTGMTVAENKAVALKGMGIGYVGGDAGTRIKRFGTGTGSLLSAVGTATGVAGTGRIRLELYDLELHGNDTAGDVLTVYRGQQCNFERVRVRSATGIGAHLTQMFNCTVAKLYTSYSGTTSTVTADLATGTPTLSNVTPTSGLKNDMLVTGTGIPDGTRVRSGGGTATVTLTKNATATTTGVTLTGLMPAMLIDGTSEGTWAGTNTFHLSDCEWETNAGPDMIVDGYDSAKPSVAVILQGAKMERDTGAFPLIVTINGQVQVENSYLYLGSNSHLIEIDQAGTVPSQLGNIRLSSGGAPTYIIKHNSGALNGTNIHAEANVSTAVVRIEAAVNIGKSVWRALTGTDLTKLVSDARGNTGRAGQVALTLPVFYTNASTQLVGNAGGWTFPKASASTLACAGQIVLPSNVPQSAGLSLIVRWVPLNTAGGNVVIKAIYKDNTSGDDITSGGTTATVTTAAGTTANIIKESGPAPGITVNPGHIVRLWFQRDGGNAADTYTGDIVILGVDLLILAIP